MPLIIPSNLKFPVTEKLLSERVFIIDENKAESQDIRPLRIGLLNLMPAATRENTEIQYFRLLGNTPLQIEPILLSFDKFRPNTGRERFEEFYQPFTNVKEKGLDGLIVSGANLERDLDTLDLLDFNRLDYYSELVDLMIWARENVASTMYCCMAAHLSLNYFYDIERKLNEKKRFGVFNHRVIPNSCEELARGLNDIVPGCHARWGEMPSKSLEALKEVKIILDNEIAGWYIASGRKGREIYIQGHPEYDREDLAGEYLRDTSRGKEIPYNYFPNNDDTKTPICNWKADSHVFFKNWVNHIYQTTNYIL